MGAWTFYDFIEPGDRNPFYEWLKDQRDEAQAFIDARILQMSGLRRWPEKWVSKYRGTDSIFELRIPFMGVQYRPLGTYAKGHSFVLLGGGIEKGRIPKETIAVVVKRELILRENPHYVRPHRFY